jgi:2-haloacid dehalogenase
LRAEEALFVDDNAANVDAAAKMGIHAVLFTDADSFRTELLRAGLL